MPMKRLLAACVIALGAWWLHREWSERFAPIEPFEEPFEEPGGGFDWPAGDYVISSGSSSGSPTYFTFNDGTKGPGRWNSSTGQIEKAEATC